MLPLVVGMFVTLVKVNTAAQISIVNQQYARSHALFLAYNSPNYPERRFIPGSFIGDSINANQMVILVGENAVSRDGGAGSNLRPEAPTQSIARGNARTNESTSQPGGKTGSRQRSKVRVLSSVSLCTPSYTISAGSGIVTADKLPNENADFRFCAYPFLERGDQ